MLHVAVQGGGVVFRCFEPDRMLCRRVRDAMTGRRICQRDQTLLLSRETAVPVQLLFGQCGGFDSVFGDHTNQTLFNCSSTLSCFLLKCQTTEHSSHRINLWSMNPGDVIQEEGVDVRGKVIDCGLGIVPCVPCWQ